MFWFAHVKRLWLLTKKRKLIYYPFPWILSECLTNWYRVGLVLYHYSLFLWSPKLNISRKKCYLMYMRIGLSFFTGFQKGHTKTHFREHFIFHVSYCSCTLPIFLEPFFPMALEPIWLNIFGFPLLCHFRKNISSRLVYCVRSKFCFLTSYFP